MANISSGDDFMCDLTIPFPSAREAEIAYNSLRVDKDPRKDVKKTLTLKENILEVHIVATKTKFLKSAIGNFLDMTNLVMQTLEEFGPPQAKKSKDCE